MEHTHKSPTRPRGQKQKQLFAEHLLTFVLLEEIWNENERNLVKLSLNEVVPFIKLHQLDSKTYREEVEPTGISSPEFPGERFRPGVSEASLSRLNIRAEMGGVR